MGKSDRNPVRYARIIVSEQRVDLLLQVTIDTTPPVSGVVLEGIKGEPEIDFQQDLTVKVHWSDFFDKESGIMFYRYGYGPECMHAEDFHITDGKEVSHTAIHSHQVKLTIPECLL